MNEVRGIFRRLLVPLWLRPERALWDAHELAAVRKMLGANFARPALEYGCTDGVNTFVMLGGEFAIDADDYEDLLSSDRTAPTPPSSSGDYFAAYRSDVRTEILQPATSRFDVGVSWREAHLVKSARLSIYDQLHLVDLQQPLAMFRAESFATIWSPNLFWNEPKFVTTLLREHVRVLAPGGRVVTILPDEAQSDAELWRKLPFMSEGWLDAMGSKVGANLTLNARSDSEWRRVFTESGLTVSAHERFLPSIAGVVYQIGFRPMFPVFLEMYRQLKAASVDDWRDVKRHWIDTVFHFMAPLCDVATHTELLGRPLWHLYELRHAP
jgi:SAM-dependent methyltransferase